MNLQKIYTLSHILLSWKPSCFKVIPIHSLIMYGWYTAKPGTCHNLLIGCYLKCTFSLYAVCYAMYLEQNTPSVMTTLQGICNYKTTGHLQSQDYRAIRWSATPHPLMAWQSESKSLVYDASVLIYVGASINA